jgi:hypothetical protein
MVGVSLIYAGLASAQSMSDGSYAVRPPSYEIPLIHDHSSTFEEGFFHGLANLARGMGDYNYSTSLAAINREEARRRYIENRQKYQQTYFEMRRANREARAYEQGPRPTQEDLVRLAKSKAPPRLDSYQYEPALGKLFWPSLLEDPSFSDEREAINRLMAERTVPTGGRGSKNYVAVKQLTDLMKDRLKSQIHDHSPTQYMTAKNFLTSLEYEAQFIPQPSGLAAK